MSKFTPATRERAVRMVQEQRDDFPSLWAAVEATARRIGCVPQTLLDWVKQAEAGDGSRVPARSTGAQRIKELEHEVEELRRANKILEVMFIGQRDPDHSHR